MEYNEELQKAMSTLQMGLTQLENYLSNKDVEYHDRFADIEYQIVKDHDTKRKILQILQEDLNGI